MEYIGKSVQRRGIEERVKGSLKFAADLKFDNMLHVKLVRLNCAHARIISIDTTEAYKLDGVRYILTAEDLPKPMPRFGPFVDDQPVIAIGETKFYGEPLAAVAATSEDIAEKAAKLVKVNYEELPGVYTIEQALSPDAPSDQAQRTGRYRPSPSLTRPSPASPPAPVPSTNRKWSAPAAPWAARC